MKKLTMKKIYSLTKSLIPKGLKNQVKNMVFGDPQDPKYWEPKTILPNSGNYYQLAHVAAFTGKGSNAGDILLPAVLRDLFVGKGKEINWTSVHVRYAVTDDAIQKINNSQGLIIGGGGLFLRDTNKNDISGWQWACSGEQLKAIKVPICIFAVGYNRFRGQEEFDNVFTDNLRVLAEKSLYLGIRNSGSINAIIKYLPSEFHHKVIFQPCMTTLTSILYPELFNDSKKDHQSFIALNCAFDRDELRFGQRKEQLLKEIANGVIQLSKKTGLNIKYYAHFYKDFEMIDVLKANNANFEVLNLGKLSPPQIIEAYKAPALVLGMRGHAQMIPFGCQTPILSLVSHDKLQWFLDDINQSHWSVDLLENHVSDKIVEKGLEILNSQSSTIEIIKNEQQKLWNVTQVNVKRFLDVLS
ncbi:polysaccharide pyruvyl transferase family protein [Geminocystis sp. GBBB08]|uniref:polysaccharide pyruvyl transferase family protein n=1 Tax=Geminocystis sp. GBBB08 TaxID=2604140 RepID=UPI0027E26F61|nr:polysaccharide pyruvyl transferase family protein [Geminocystis sp. GBBB08]MBL1210145.1 polysaccharide pyruvyl transferase family protein [Geminocystis sp. GBBB08]